MKDLVFNGYEARDPIVFRGSRVCRKTCLNRCPSTKTIQCSLNFRNIVT
eukprot:UN12407